MTGLDVDVESACHCQSCTCVRKGNQFSRRIRVYMLVNSRAIPIALETPSRLVRVELWRAVCQCWTSLPQRIVGTVPSRHSPEYARLIL